MIKQKHRKLVSFLIITCMLFVMVNPITYAQVAGNNASNAGSNNEPLNNSDNLGVLAKDTEEITLFNLVPSILPTDTVTYYVGGETGTTTGTIGESSEYPYATLYDAMEVVNQKGGNYHIIIQGNTIESHAINIGDGINTFNVTISDISAVSGSAISGGAVSGSAITEESASEMSVTGAAITSAVTGDSLITVNHYASLTLKGCFDTAETGLKFNGSASATYALFDVAKDSVLKLCAGVTIQNNNNTNNSAQYEDYGAWCGGIYNEGHFIMEGGIISGNSGGEYGGVRNKGSFTLSGGTITGNTGRQCGGVYNEGAIEMSGGEINYNNSGMASGVFNDYTGTFDMAGGTIINSDPASYAGIYSCGNFTISGNATITGTNKAKNVYLYKQSYFTVGSDLTCEDNISIELNLCSPGVRVIGGTAELIKNNYHKFSLNQPYYANYSITEEGILEYHGTIATYYVDGTVGSDSNPGTLELPFATIQKAKTQIYFDGNVGIIYICSDITLTETVTLTGTITIRNKGEKHTIYCGGSSISNMFNVYGFLSLGDSEKNETDPTIDLALDGSDLPYNCSIIYNGSILQVYSGVSIQNSNLHSAGAIGNQGNITMYGGIINNNNASYGAGIYNLLSSTFTMKGGSITDNTSYIGGAVYNAGKFIMEGGSISNNIAHDYGNGVFCSAGSFTLMDDAMISSNDDICISKDSIDNVVTIGGKLVGAAPVANISVKNYYENGLSAGDQIVVSGKEYSFTEEDLAKISLSDTRFFLNNSGIAKAELQDSYLHLYYTNSNIYYTGSEIKLSVLVYLKKALTEGVNYTVSYENNIDAGTATICVDGIGDFCGQVRKTFIIKKAMINQITTAAPAAQTFKASENKSEAELLATIALANVNATYSGGTVMLPISWKLTGGAYNPKGGTYTYTGTPTGNNNIDAGNLKSTTRISVTAVEPDKPSFQDIFIAKGKNTKATASDFGSSILPTSGVTLADGTEIHYTIEWDNQTLDTTVELESTEFTGTITYTDAPAWATLPSDLTVKRTVSVALVTSFAIMASVDGGGDINPKGNIIVNRNTNQEFNIIPAVGYLITDVLVDGISVGAVTGYTFYDVTKEHSIKVIFTKKAETPTPSPTPTITPTTTPSPTATPSPEQEDVKKVQAEVSVSVEQNEEGNELNASVDISEEDLHEMVDTGETSEETVIIIPISSEEFTQQIHDSGALNVNIKVTVPDSLLENSNIAGCDIQLDSDIIQAAKDTGKDVSVSILDENGTEKYSWTFAGNDLADSNNAVSDINLSLKVETVENNSDLSDLLSQGSLSGNDSSNSLVINFSHHGDLPSQASVKIYVGNLGFTAGQTIYLYYYNSDTGKLETLPYSSDYQVDNDGYVTINIVHCSDYILLPQKADSIMITSLLNQISITSEKLNLYLGKTAYSTATININLPSTLELVKDLQDKTSGSAVGAVAVSYQSSNRNVAEVSSLGNVTAKGIGKAVIDVTVKLYSGKTKTFKINITVKKPYITLTRSIDAMGVGKSFTFEAKAYGLDMVDIIWSTTEPSIIVIKKKTGKATAKTKGTDYVTASIGSTSIKIKVIIK